MPDHDKDLSLLADSIRQAGAIGRRYFGNAPRRWDKGGGQGPVTEADLAVNELLSSQLRAARPGYGWLSEESEDTNGRRDCESVFIVDPIDGTRAFIEGSRDWAVSIAVAHGTTITAAAVYLPMRDALYTATVGGGATLNGAPLTISPQTELEKATVLATKANFQPEYWRDGQIPPVTRAFRSSLAYRLCLVAQGRFDAMLTLRPSWEWDIAAGSLIVAEAGGVAHDQTGCALRFNNSHPQVNGLLAGGAIVPPLQAQLAGPFPPASS